MSVPVSPTVFEGIEAVRQAGLTNMLDRPRVAELCEEMGFPEAAEWVRENRDLYAQAIFHGDDPMTDFHATRMGHRFFENTMPELARQLARLNDNLERLIAALPKETQGDPR